MPTANPPAFEQAVRGYLAAARDQFNYEQLLHTFLSVDRFRQWAQVIERYRGVRGAAVLSSGCGFGGSLVAYRDAGARVAVGVEVDADYARMAGLRIADLPGAAVALYDGDRLPLRSGSFDVIESMDVVEHTTDPAAYLDELVRVLAPDGIILLVTPNRLWPVEQHLGIAGPPWLPVGVADRLFTALAAVPGLDQDRRFRYRRLAGMRTQNLSLRRLRGLARDAGLFLRLVHPGEHSGHWPLPGTGPAVQRLAEHRLAKFVAPTRTLVTVLSRERPHG